MSSPTKSSSQTKNLQDTQFQEQIQNIESQFGQKFRKLAQLWAPSLRLAILIGIATIAVLVRVYAVIRYESVIHEFDPWFNYRTTKFIVENGEGLYGLWNWFDSESWYPLGRAVGGTVYPGLMSTAYIFWWTLQNIFCLPVDIRNVCVFIAPIFAALSAFTTYLFTKEITKRSEAGLLAALFISVCPTYMSRSVAGSYDNEAVSIWALLYCFYTWIKAANTGGLWWGANSGLALFYMVASWGGYAFVINIIPIFVLFLMITKRYTTKVYVAYNMFYILGTFLSMQIPFVGFQAIKSSEHLGSHAVFILVNSVAFVQFCKQYMPQKQFDHIVKLIAYIFGISVVLIFAFVILSGFSKWSGRSMTLLDPTYAKKYIPIIASISEHQASTWSSFFFDLHFLMLFTPIGLYYCSKNPNYGKIFVLMYVVLSVYFASVMIRLLLVLGPASCIAAGIGVSFVFRNFAKSIRQAVLGEDVEKLKLINKPRKTKRRISPIFALVGFVLMGYLISIYIFHSHFTGAEAYSSPSIILSSKDRFGNRHIIDDFREAYYWLRMNTSRDSKILSWWDYGYQITGMSNRTVIADNNTWNNTHIATIGLALASNEKDAYEICDKLDANYVLIIFGGASYYSGDDINKFIWMVRIASGVYPHVKEEHFYSKGRYRVDYDMSKTMRDSLMFKLSFYRFGDLMTSYGKPTGYDTVRQSEVGEKNIKLNYFREAFTSENWIVRIFERLPRKNREQISLKSKKNTLPQNLEEFKKKLDIFDEHPSNYQFVVKKKRKVASYSS